MPNKGLTFPPEVLQRNEVDLLLRSFAPTWTGDRNRAIVALSLYAQLRCHETLQLAPSDIDWNAGSVTVRRGKGGKRRVAGVQRERLDEFVRPWLRNRPTSDYLFCSNRGNRIDESYVRKFLARQAKSAGISKRVHTHCLRHTGAVRLVEAGINLLHLQSQLGHESLATTEKYIRHLAPQSVAVISEVSW